MKRFHLMSGGFGVASILAAFCLGIVVTGTVVLAVGPAVTREHYTVTEDMALFDCARHGNGRCAPSLGVTGEVTVLLTGDPLSDCVSLLASVGLSGDLCAPVARNRG